MNCILISTALNAYFIAPRVHVGSKSKAAIIPLERAIKIRDTYPANQYQIQIVTDFLTELYVRP